MQHSAITPLWVGFIQMVFFSDNKGCSEHPNIYCSYKGCSEYLDIYCSTKDAVSTLIPTGFHKGCSEDPGIYIFLCVYWSLLSGL